MRPPGEIRQALARAAVQLAQVSDGATWRELAEHAQVGYLDARRTVEHMARSGGLVVIGAQKREHSRRWMNIYAPPPDDAPPDPADEPVVPAVNASLDDLAAITRAWAEL